MVGFPLFEPLLIGAEVVVVGKRLPIDEDAPEEVAEGVIVLDDMVATDSCGRSKIIESQLRGCLFWRRILTRKDAWDLICP